MKFKEIIFTDNRATKIYKDYIHRVQRSISTLDTENQLEILLELNSHIHEGLTYTHTSGINELESLQNVLEKLGKPEVFLKPLVAQKKLDEATRSFNPLKIAKALMLNIGNGISYIIFAFLYLFLFSFLFLIVAKIVNPENVGLYYRAHDIFILGIYKNDQGLIYNQYEQLGNWFIPVLLLAVALIYILLTLALRLKRTIKNNIL